MEWQGRVWCGKARILFKARTGGDRLGGVRLGVVYFKLG